MYNLMSFKRCKHLFSRLPQPGHGRFPKPLKISLCHFEAVQKAVPKRPVYKSLCIWVSPE